MSHVYGPGQRGGRKHEIAVDFAIRKLGGHWARTGFHKALRAEVLSDGPDDDGNELSQEQLKELFPLTPKWVPDAWKIDIPTLTVHAIEAGHNHDDKWNSIVDYWWAIDDASWFLNIHLIDYEHLIINSLSDADIGFVVYQIEAKNNNFPKEYDYEALAKSLRIDIVNDPTPA